MGSLQRDSPQDVLLQGAGIRRAALVLQRHQGAGPHRTAVLERLQHGRSVRRCGRVARGCHGFRHFPTSAGEQARLLSSGGTK